MLRRPSTTGLASSAGPGCASSAEPLTVGVEEEYILVDPGSGLPVPLGEQVAGAARTSRALEPDDVQRELLQAQLEVATPVCQDLDEVGGHLLRLRHELGGAAEAHGCRLVAVGASPFLDRVPVEITDEPRYRALQAGAPALVAEQLINGMHVHVSVPDRRCAVAALNRIRVWLPVLAALSANSPYWRGQDTGFHSWRTIVFDRWPVSGPPPHFDDDADYDRRVEALLRSGVVADRHSLYWQARLSDRYPTVEVRAADVQLRVDDAVMLAGLIRGLVATALREDERGGVPVDRPDPELLRVAMWRAARHGLDGDLFDLRRGTQRRAGDLVLDLLEHVEPALETRGDAQQVTRLVERLLREGNAADRQRRIVDESGMGALVPFLAAETVAV